MSSQICLKTPSRSLHAPWQSIPRSATCPQCVKRCFVLSASRSMTRAWTSSAPRRGTLFVRALTVNPCVRLQFKVHRSTPVTRSRGPRYCTHLLANKLVNSQPFLIQRSMMRISSRLRTTAIAWENLGFRFIRTHHHWHLYSTLALEALKRQWPIAGQKSTSLRAQPLFPSPDLSLNKHLAPSPPCL